MNVLCRRRDLTGGLARLSRATRGFVPGYRSGVRLTADESGLRLSSKGVTVSVDAMVNTRGVFQSSVDSPWLNDALRSFPDCRVDVDLHGGRLWFTCAGSTLAIDALPVA